MRRSALLLLLAAATNVLETPLAAPARNVFAAAADPAGFQIMEARTRDGSIFLIARLNDVNLLMRGTNPENEPAVEEAVEEDDHPQNDEMVRPQPTIQFQNGTLEEFIFGKGSGWTTAQSVDRELKVVLRDAIERVDAACQLTPQQRKKLELAGRGDIQRFLDRVERLKAAFQQNESIRTPEQFREWVTPLGREIEALRRMLGDGVFGKKSLFDKTRNGILSGEQSDQVALLRTRGSKVPSIPVGGWLNGDAPDYRGKPYLIHFWATGSALSLQDLPTLTKLASEGASIVGVHALNAPEFAIKDIIRKERLPYSTLPATHAAWSSYFKIDGCPVQSLPYCIVVDRNGFVAAHGALSTSLLEKFQRLRNDADGKPAPK